MEPETKIEVAHRLLQSGGTILIAGERFDYLSDEIKRHPQILIWEDRRQDYLNKSVPSNTRAILFSRFISHPKSEKLIRAAKSLRIPFFPLLNSGELKDVITKLMEKMDIPKPVVRVPESWEIALAAQSVEKPAIPIHIPSPGPEVSVVTLKEEVAEMPTLRTAERGEHNTILAKELGNEGNWIEAGRLVDVYKNEYGIKATKGAIAQAILKYRRNGAVPASSVSKESKEKPVKKQEEVSEFAELKKLLVDAKAGIDLFLDSFGKFEKEYNKLRKQREKLKAFFE